MQTVDTLLDAVKSANGIKSDYKLAQFLEVTQHTIANYRHGRSRPDDKTLERLAQLGGIDLAEVDVLAAKLQAERTQSEEAKRLWLRIANRLQAGGAHVGFMVALALSALLGAAPRAEASTLPDEAVKSSSVVFIMSNGIRRWLRRIMLQWSHVQGPKAHPQPALAL